MPAIYCGTLQSCWHCGTLSSRAVCTILLKSEPSGVLSEEGLELGAANGVPLRNVGMIAHLCSRDISSSLIHVPSLEKKGYKSFQHNHVASHAQENPYHTNLLMEKA